MFDVLRLLFSWLPAPLNIICFGGICVLLIAALIRLVGKVLDMLPFT